MFAHIVSAEGHVEGFDRVTRLAREQLPVVRDLPGFRGFYLLTDRDSGRLVTISLWDTKEQMRAGEAQVAQSASHAAPADVAEGRAAPGAAIAGVRSDVYEVEESA